MGSKGKNNKSFTLWEELELRVSTDSGKVAIYKKTYNDKRQGRTPLPIEDRSYFVHIPVPNTKGGIRKSLLTKDRTTAITKVNEMVVNVMVDLRSGNSIIPVPVEDVVEKFLKHKKSRTRGRWESKRDRGKKSFEDWYISSSSRRDDVLKKERNVKKAEKHLKAELALILSLIHI